MESSAEEKPVHTEKCLGLADEMIVSADEQCRETRRVSRVRLKPDSTR